MNKSKTSSCEPISKPKFVRRILVAYIVYHVERNNDGVKDLILGASGNNVNGANTGMIFVFLNPFE